MASVTQKTAIGKQLEDMTECSICTETYKDPRTLPCFHTFCLTCIEGFSRDKQPGDDVTCPLCRKEFKVPESGVKGLPKNFLIEQLKQLKELSGTEVIKSICEGCSVDETDVNKKKTAVNYCVECNEKLCETCVDAHKKVKISREHKLVKIGQGSSVNEITTNISIVYCEKHKNKCVELYCFECRSAICIMCFVEVHQSHKCIDVNKVADEFRRKITTDASNMTDCAKRCSELMNSVLSEKTKFVNKVVDVTREINKQAEYLKNMIDKQKEKLLHEVESTKTSRMKQVDNVVGDIEQHMSFVSSLIKYSEELRDKGTASEVARQTSSLHDRVDELLKLDVIQGAVNDLGSVDVKFTAAKTSDNLVGNIQVKDVKEKMNADGKPYVLDCSFQLNMPTFSSSSSQEKPISQLTNVKSTMPTLTHVIPGDRPVAGVTSLNNQLFVMRRPCKEQIEVYETKTFTLQRTLRVDGLTDSVYYECRLASCATNNCLYVSDFGNTISRVELIANNNVFTWNVGSAPTGLSVNNACNVLVTCCHGNTIQEYTTRGSLVREICLQSDVTWPMHTIQLTNGQHVVSHWEPVHGISVVDSEGRVIVSYRNKPDSQITLLNCPGQLAVDKNGCILVADSDNNRIVLLNSSLNKSRDLPVIVDGGLEDPWCLYLDESRDRLYVGEFGGRRVLVIDNVLDCSI